MLKSGLEKLPRLSSANDSTPHNLTLVTDLITLKEPAHPFLQIDLRERIMARIWYPQAQKQQCGWTHFLVSHVKGKSFR